MGAREEATLFKTLDALTRRRVAMHPLAVLAGFRIWF